MLKICAVLTAKPELTHQQFLYYWFEEHAAIINALPGIRGYVQNAAIETKEPLPFNGLAEVYFDSKKAIGVAFASPEADVMREHEKLFIGKIEWIISEAPEGASARQTIPAAQAG